MHLHLVSFPLSRAAHFFDSCREQERVSQSCARKRGRTYLLEEQVFSSRYFEGEKEALEGGEGIQSGVGSTNQARLPDKPHTWRLPLPNCLPFLLQIQRITEIFLIPRLHLPRTKSESTGLLLIGQEREKCGARISGLLPFCS